jgi:hypothetical protein
MKDKPRVRGTNIQWNMAVRANCPLDQSTNDISNASGIGLGLSYLFQHVIGPFLVAIKIALQDVRKKEKPENGKHDKQFYENDPP